MKKLLPFAFTMMLLLAANGVSAQDAESDVPPVRLPQAGDIGLGFDAVPFLEYLGNIFNNTQNNSVGTDFPGHSGQVFGKYFLNDHMAIRARLRLDQDRFTDRSRVILDNQPVPNPDVQVTDEWITSSTDIHLGGGLEFRRGEGKIVGVFGAEAGFLYRRTAIDYDYGNPISQVNPQPSATFWSFNNNRYERQIEVRRDRQFGAGLNGFIGVEYFFAPKISLGAEFLLGVSYMQSYRDETTYEYWDTVTGSVQTRSAISEGGNFFQLETGNYGGSINLMFYF